MTQETNNQNEQKRPKKENSVMRIRIKRNTFLAIQLYFKELSCSQDIMEIVCRQFLLDRRPDFLDFLDKINLD